MPDSSIVYDNINKRLVAIIDDEKFSIPVSVTGTWRASISASEILAKGGGKIPLEDCVAALKRYRSRNRKSLTVSVAP